MPCFSCYFDMLFTARFDMLLHMPRAYMLHYAIISHDMPLRHAIAIR